MFDWKNDGKACCTVLSCYSSRPVWMRNWMLPLFCSVYSYHLKKVDTGCVCFAFDPPGVSSPPLSSVRNGWSAWTPRCAPPLAWRTSSPSPSTPGAWTCTPARRSSMASCADQVRTLPPPARPHANPSRTGRLCSVRRRTRDLLVQERGGEAGLWHSKRLEDIRHQQQVQVIAAFIQDTCCCVDFCHSQLEDRSGLCFHWRTAQCVCVCYCTPLVLRPGQIRAQPRIRCLLTETFVEPSQPFGSVSLSLC